MIRVTELAHREVARVLCPGDVAVDATAGNGHDTLFLAERVGPEGRVLAFDVQETALEHTRQRLREHRLLDRVRLIAADHARLNEHLAPGEAKAILFNLGYLPGSDHAFTTRAESTLSALGRALECLADGGLLSIVAYPGHPEGARESEALTGWLARLPGEYVQDLQRDPERDQAPYLVTVARS